MNRKTLQLTKEQAEDLRWNDDVEGFEIIQNEMIDGGRWYLWRQVIFKKDGDFYGYSYREPKTEIQEWTNVEEDGLTAYQVFPRTVNKVVYD